MNLLEGEPKLLDGNRAQPLLRKAVPVAEAIVEALDQAGIDTVLTLPGGDTQGLFDALYDRRDHIRCVLVREESLAAAMAEVYGRVNGSPALVIAQGAWFLSNGAMGTLEALVGSSPMVILTDVSDGSPASQHAPGQSGAGHYGSWDAKQAISGFVKQLWVVHEAAALIQTIQLAVKHARSGQPGPTAVLFYSTALKGQAGPDTAPPLYGSAGYLVRDRRGADPDAVAAAVRTVCDARRPVIIAGGGLRVSRSGEALAEFAEAFEIPFTTTVSGKGILSETHPLSLGMMGSYGLDAANAEVGRADVIIAVATKLSSGDTVNQHPALIDPRRQRLIHIDIEPRNLAWTLPAAHALVGDAGAVVDQLLAAATSAGSPKFNGAQRVLDTFSEFGSYEVPESLSDSVPIKPQRLIHELSSTLPRDVVIACDAGENRIFMSHHYRVGSAGGLIQPGSVAGMGYGIPAALGAKLAEPHRRVFAVCGDGGFAMTMNGLLTAIEENLPITVIVMNNSALGWIRNKQGHRPIASSFNSFDYSAIARGMGCRGRRVTEPVELVDALTEALAPSDVPFVIDVVTDPSESFEKVRSTLLRQGAEARMLGLETVE